MKIKNTFLLKSIWMNKPDKINKKQVVGSYEKGGLKMFDIDCFSKALNLTWVRVIF